MPRIIVKCRYIKSDAAHRSNLISYMSTREGVDKNIDAEHPVTKKQDEMIARLLRSTPDAKDMFEYEDYIASPTAKTASEFITQALEQNADRFVDRKIFLEYIANRPRVQKLGAHGLFSDTGDAINLSQVQQEVADHPGNVWTNVVSLRREDASRLGFDNAAAWRSLMREKRNDIAAYMRIKPENLKWYAAYHDEGAHPHIHFIAYSTDPNEAYLTKKSIDGIRSCLAREIFRQDLLQIYSEQTIRRDTLNRKSLSVMREMCTQMQNGVCDNPQIGALMQTLANRLSKTGGKKVYGYLKGSFIVTKTGTHPMQTKLELFFKWGITFDAPYKIVEKSARKVEYASANKLAAAILEKYPPEELPFEQTIEQPPKPVTRRKPKQTDENKPPVRGA